MQQIIFLVTSLEGLHKPNFSRQLTAALQENVPVKLLVALVDFDAAWEVRQFIERVARNDERVHRVRIVTIAELAAKDAGLALSAEERNQPDLTAYTERVFTTDHDQIRRYLDHGHLRAELHQLDDQTPMVLRHYLHDQLIQVDTYDLTGRVVGVAKIQDGVVQTSYLLNQRGEAILRLTRHEQTVEHVYNLGADSVMLATEFSDAKQAAALNNMSHRQRERTLAKSVDHTEMISTTENYYSVLVYASYNRYRDVFTYYQTVLDQLMTPQTRLYVDLAVNAVLSPRMPRQLIFNY